LKFAVISALLLIPMFTGAQTVDINRHDGSVESAHVDKVVTYPNGQKIVYLNHNQAAPDKVAVGDFRRVHGADGRMEVRYVVGSHHDSNGKEVFVTDNGSPLSEPGVKLQMKPSTDFLIRDNRNSATLRNQPLKARIDQAVGVVVSPADGRGHQFTEAYIIPGADDGSAVVQARDMITDGYKVDEKSIVSTIQEMKRGFQIEVSLPTWRSLFADSQTRGTLLVDMIAAAKSRTNFERPSFLVDDGKSEPSLSLVRDKKLGEVFDKTEPARKIAIELKAGGSAPEIGRETAHQMLRDGAGAAGR
jgi:hypothetical protein